MKKSKLESKNYNLALSFFEFCEKNPELRFWQALRNWSGAEFVLLADSPKTEIGRLQYALWHPDTLRDTYHYKGKTE